MKVSPLLAPLCASLGDFLAKPLDVVGLSGESAVAILDANKPVFYVVSPLVWEHMNNARIVSEKAVAQSELTGSVLSILNYFSP